mmetsp:Transcript_137177/g.438670  ORF Transcript_137177/g.438670 Transcript_137177/m.438670 type:complete len:92 (+) Transcript_137177:254-529(+)
MTCMQPLTFGVAATGPVFVAFATLLGIPFNLALDFAFRGEVLSGFDILGTVLVVVSFLVLATSPDPAQPEPLLQPQQAPCDCTGRNVVLRA